MLDTAGEMAAVAAELSAAPVTESPTVTTSASPEVSPEAASGAIAASETPNEAQQTGEASLAEKPKGPLPYERHEAILANTRKEYDAKLEALKWAEGLSADDIQRQREWYSFADRDPVGFHNWLTAQLKSNPIYAGKLEGATQPAEDPKPKPDVLLEDGRMVYSDEQLERVFDWRERQNERKQQERQTEQSEIQQQSKAEAQSILADAKTWVGFEQHKTAIADMMVKDGRVTLESAYRRIVMPALEAERNDAKARAREEVLNELKQKPTATTTNPGAAVVAPPKSYKGMSTEDIMRSVHAELAG